MIRSLQSLWLKQSIAYWGYLGGDCEFVSLAVVNPSVPTLLTKKTLFSISLCVGSRNALLLAVLAFPCWLFIRPLLCFFKELI